MVLSDVHLTDIRLEGPRFKPRQVVQHYLIEIDHDILSMVILSLLLIQKGLFSVSGERLPLIGVSLSRKIVVR